MSFILLGALWQETLTDMPGEKKEQVLLLKLGAGGH